MFSLVTITYGDSTPISSPDIANLLNRDANGVTFPDGVPMQIIIRLRTRTRLNRLHIGTANVGALTCSLDGASTDVVCGIIYSIIMGSVIKYLLAAGF